MSKQTFIKGSAILIAAGAVVKILGFVNKMVVVRIIGEEGFGLFTMAFPTLLLTVTITQLGLPVAISKMVSEADAVGDRQKIKRVLVISLTTTGVLSIIFTTLMMLFVPLLAKTVFTDERIMYPLLAIAPIVPIVALSSVLRGYFQGRQDMSPYAISQIIEQVLRIIFSVLLALLLLPYGVGLAAAGAISANVIGELGSMIFMFTMFKKKKKVKIRRRFGQYLKGGQATFRSLMRIGLPATGSRLIGSISFFFEPIIIVQSLAIAGISSELATKQYGELEGLVLPLLTLPTFITYALSVSLVPTIGEASARSQYGIIHSRLNQALKIAMITGGLSVVVTYVFAWPIMELMYGTGHASVYVKFMAPFFFIYFFQAPLQAALQALDHAKAAMMNTVFGAMIKIALIFTLATRPELGIMGAALAFTVNAVLVTLLHFASVVKSIGFTLVVRDYGKGLFCLAVTAVFASIIHKYALPTLSLLPRTVIEISIVTIAYLLLIILSGLINREEIKALPIIGKWAK